MRFLTKKIAENASSTVICFVYEDVEEKTQLFDCLDNLSNNELSKQIYEHKIIKGSHCETFKYSINKSLNVLIVGLGKKENLTRQKFSQAVASATRIAKTMTTNQSIAFELIEHRSKTSCCIENNFSKAQAAQLLLCAARIGLYEFNKYLSDKKPQVETIEILDNDILPEIEKRAQIGAYTSYAMKFAKDLINESAQVATPNYIASLALQIAKDNHLEARIYNKDKIKALGMNAFLAVGQGSVNEPKLVHLIYKPQKEVERKIALIGKGITFDAGGMNIKPAASMLTMKTDMSGAASVLGIIQAISKLEPNIELHVICALCENMTSGSAYKQGDVLTAMNGKTIEVDNTDAEGRITLADALCYADTLDVDEVIDIATLTGAVIVSLGHNITGVMGNNQSQIDKFIECSKYNAENVWQMPILEELKDNLKSEIADMKNTGGRNAGTSTAAWFLSNFTKSTSWMHLDIAGTAAPEKSNKETLGGPTGVMIRTLINYLIN